MRYAINFDKIINQLVPYYLGGRRLILFLQSCVKPLQQLNIDFVNYAKETRIEAAMTSQVFKLEWFLNHKFKKYFEDSGALITIKNGIKLGVPVYSESATDIADDDGLKLWKEEGEQEHEDAVFYRDDELTETSSHSFLVCVPKLWRQKDKSGNEIDQLIDGITVDQFKAQVSYWVDKYRLSNKSYDIIINTL